MRCPAQHRILLVAGQAPKGYMSRSSNNDVTQSDYQALAEFRYQIRRYLAFGDKAAEAAGLRSRQYQLLLALKGLPEGMEASIKNLADRLGIRHHSTVELVDRLEKRGLVKRERSSVHRSFVFVRITKDGEMMLRKLVASRKADLKVAGPILVKTLSTLTKQNSRRTKA
jgi:DNA-binding MarR family transcriptional regulator